MKKLLYFALCLLSASQAVPQGIDASPREALRQRLADVFSNSLIYTGMAANIPEIRKNPAAYLLKDEQVDKLDDPRLMATLDLDTWSNRSDADQDMPVFFNVAAGRYEIMPIRFAYCSNAMIKFAYDYIAALSKMDRSLRGAPLGEGLAALVASEVNYQTAAACLPSEVRPQSTFVNALLLYEPSILQTAFVEQGDLRSIVGQAVERMCAVEDRVTYRPLHQDMEWMFSRGAKMTYNLEEALPPHPDSLERLVQLAKASIANASIRARIVAAAAANRFCVPIDGNGEVDERDSWESDFNAELKAVGKELAARVNPRTGEALEVLVGDKPLRHDPSVLVPLMVMATQLDASELREFKGKDKSQFLEAMKKAKHTRQVLDLAGSDPAITQIESDKSAGETENTTHIFSKVLLRWDKLERIGHTQTEQACFEEVTVALVDIEPLGSAKAIKGVEADMLVTVKDENGTISQIAAADTKEGMSVLGYGGKTQYGDEEPQKTWFRIWRKEINLVPRVVETVIGEGKAAGCLVCGVDTGVSVKVVPKDGVKNTKTKKVAWREAWHLDPSTTIPYNPDVNLPAINWVKQVQRETSLVYFHLTHSKRYPLPDNIVVAPTANPDLCLIVEAAPIRAGLIESSESISGPDGWIELGKLVGDKCDRGDIVKPGTAVHGIHRKAPDWQWPMLDFTKHETRIVHNSPCTLTNYYRLEFNKGATLTLGPTNWLLVASKNGLFEETIISELSDGDQIVSDVGPSGEPILKTLASLSIVRNKTPLPFQALEVANLGYAPVGPALVSVHKIDLDVHQAGIAQGAQISLPSGGVADVSTNLMMSDAIAVWPDDWQFSGSKETLFFDPAVGFVPGKTEIIADRMTSRTQLLALRSPDGTARKTLELGPSHQVMIKDKGGRYEYTNVYHLKPGHAVCAALPGESEPTAWPIESITPKFYAYKRLGLPTTSTGARSWQNAYALTDTGIVNGMMVLFGKPAVKVKQGLKSPAKPGMPGQGDATGKSDGLTEGGGPSPKDIEGGVIAKMRNLSSQDPVNLGKNFVDLMRKRGEDIRELMSQEAGAVKYKETNVLRFVKGRLPAGMDVLDPGEAGAGLKRFVSQVLLVRDEWLKQPYTTRLGLLLRLESLAAIYAFECGAKSTAEALLQDIVEVSAVTLTEKDKCSSRVKSGQGLMYMLKLSSWLHGVDDENFEVAISVPVSEAISAFHQRHKLSPDRVLLDQDGGVRSLTAPIFYRNLADAAGEYPFYLPLPNRNGDLSSEHPELESFAEWLGQIKSLKENGSQDEVQPYAQQEEVFQPEHPRLTSELYSLI